MLCALPQRSEINTGLLSPPNVLMIDLFGAPGARTLNCSPLTNERLKHLVETADVGPFRATGLRPALASLKRIFAAVRESSPQLYASVHCAGMLCCRRMRGSQMLYSNHSWGSAIDLYCGDCVTPFGSPHTSLGVLQLYPHFHAEGWYWGAAFPTPDAMHFEVSTQLLRRWQEEGAI